MLATRLGLPRVRGESGFVVALLIDALGTGLYLPFSLLYFQAVAHLPLPAIGVALTIATVATLPMTPLTGALVDRWGARRLVIASQLLQALGFVGYLVVQSIPVLVATALLVTAGSRAFYAASTALIAQVAGPSERDRWYGFVGATQSLGLAAGGLLAGVVVAAPGAVGYRALILADTLSFLLAAFLLHRHMEDPSLPHVTARQAGGYRAVLADRPFLGLIACNVVFALCGLMLTVGLAIYATESLGLSTAIVGAAFAVSTLLTLGTQTLIVRWLEPYRRTRVLAAAAAIRALGGCLFVLALVLPRAVLVPYIFIVVGIYTLGGLVSSPTATALAASAAPVGLQARYLALYELTWGIAATLAPGVFTVLYAGSAVLPWAMVTGLALIVGVVVVRLEPHLPAHAVRAEVAPDDG